MFGRKISRRDSLFVMGSGAALAAAPGFNLSCKSKTPEAEPSNAEAQSPQGIRA
jgi:hypothetical protein